MASVFAHIVNLFDDGQGVSACQILCPAPSGLAAKGRESSNFGATWRGQLTSVFTRIKILSCNSQGVSACQILCSARFRFDRQRAGKCKLRRNLAGPFVIRYLSYYKHKLRWPRCINSPNFRLREKSKVAATWRGQLASVFAHITNLSCDS